MRRESGLFSGMWQFPAVEVRKNARAELQRYLPSVKPKNSPQRTQSAQRAKGTSWQELPAVKHTFTFREITLLPFLVRVERLPKMEGARVKKLAALERLPISSATRKVLHAALRFV